MAMAPTVVFMFSPPTAGPDMSREWDAVAKKRKSRERREEKKTNETHTQLHRTHLSLLEPFPRSGYKLLHDT